MSLRERVVFEVGGWTVDSLALSISNAEKEEHLPAKAMAVLVYLAENHGRLVTREELIAQVWDGNAYVGEKTLTNAVWRIRQILGRDAHDVDFIKTTPKTGYQLIPAPTIVDTDSQSRPPTRGAGNMARASGLALAALVVLGLAWRSISTPTGLAVDEPLAIVTHLPGRELYAAPAPDGSQFAFMHVDRSGEQTLYVQSLTQADGQPSKFTSSGTSNFSPSWAPDSRHLAYVRIDDERDECGVVVRDMELGEEWPVAACADTEQRTLSWSPDGQWLVYRKDDPIDGPGLYLKAMSAEFRALDELQDRRISCSGCLLIDQEVSWSPDSRTLAVTRTRNEMSEDIYRFDIDTWTFSRLTTGESSIEGHTWYKTGENLLYVSDKHSLNRRIWSLDVLSREKREIGYEGAGFPVYLPGYQSIMFYKRRAQAYIAAVTLDEDDSSLRFPSAVIQTSGSERNPAYSSAANKLVYFSNVSGHNEIWMADPDGSNRQQLTEIKTDARYPGWSPDGGQIAFIAYDPYSESATIRIYDVATKSVRLLTSKFDDIGAPTWASDGQSLIVPSWQGNDEVDLWRISIDGDQIRRLTSNNAKFGRESPDGRHLFYSKLEERGLFAMGLDDGEEVLIIDDMVTSGFGNWTWAGPTRILYSRHKDDHSEIVEFDLDDERQAVVIKHPSRLVHRGGMLSYSAVHNLLYFTHREPQQIDILMAPNPL